MYLTLYATKELQARSKYAPVAGRTKLIVYYLLLFSLANIAERRVRP